MNNFKIFLLALTTIMGPSIFAQSTLIWSDPIVVASGSFDNTRPRIALTDGETPVVLWGKNSTDVNYFSRWNGIEFSAPEQITPPGTDAFVSSWAGSEIAAAGDTVFVVYKAEPSSTGSIYTRRSLDGGMTWEDTVKVDIDPTYISEFPSITTGPIGTPIITYMESDAGWADPRYVVSNSSDLGQSYMAATAASEVHAPNEVCDCCPADIIYGNGKQLLLFRNNDNNERDIWATTSSNGGADFDQGSDIDFGTLILSVCPSSGPTGIISGDSIYYAWMNILGTSNRVYVGSAGLNDLAPITNAMMDPSVPTNTIQNYPRIAGANDTLAIVWQQTISGSSECVLQFSTNGVQGLSAKDTVNLDLAGGQTNPDVAYSNGYFHFVWQNNSSNEVIYRRAQLTEITSIPEDFWVNQAEVSIGRSGDQLVISSFTPIRELSVFDLQGRSLGRVTGKGALELDWPVLTNGTYLFNVLLEDGRSTTVKWSGVGQ